MSRFSRFYKWGAIARSASDVALIPGPPRAIDQQGRQFLPYTITLPVGGHVVERFSPVEVAPGGAPRP